MNSSAAWGDRRLENEWSQNIYGALHVPQHVQGGMLQKDALKSILEGFFFLVSITKMFILRLEKQLLC